jgi:DNA adenine methylase
MSKKHNSIFIKSPLNYIGGKYKILSQIIPLFPKEIDCFVDLFTGGGNIGININAKKIILNDNLVYLIDLYKLFQKMSIEDILNYINKQINTYNLSLTNVEGYKNIRNFYNKTKNPLDLFVLISYSFNHQIRFNNNHDFNNPFGKERSHFNSSIKNNLENFIQALKNKNIELYAKKFDEFDFTKLNGNDFVYCDPPYLITTGTYNDSKRGFTGWGLIEENMLLTILKKLDNNNIKFALSNVLEHKGKSNNILKEWLKKNEHFIVTNINMNYSNSNYQTKIKNKMTTQEVLITNYLP